MLCLTCNPFENIRISEEISITVLGINGNEDDAPVYTTLVESILDWMPTKPSHRGSFPA